MVLPELTGIGAMPAARASLASLEKRWAPAISPISLAGGQRPEAGLGEQLRRDLGDELGDLGLERVDGRRELAQAAQLVAGDPDARGLLGAGQAPARSASLHFFESSALPGSVSSGQRSCRCQSRSLLSAARMRTSRSR